MKLTLPKPAVPAGAGARGRWASCQVFSPFVTPINKWTLPHDTAFAGAVHHDPDVQMLKLSPAWWRTILELRRAAGEVSLEEHCLTCVRRTTWAASLIGNAPG
jgi:alpha-beta hydrolase superfamily lysophospholipase